MFIWQNKRIKHAIVHDIGRTLKSGKNDKSLLIFIKIYIIDLYIIFRI